MKYRIIYGNGLNPHKTEETNNKQKAIKWANESRIPATVEIIATGEIIHENAAQRRINKNLTTLRNLAGAHRAGKKIIRTI